MNRKDELRKIIEDAQAELKHLNRYLTWQEACKYMYENKEEKMQVSSNSDGSIYHSYIGVGILYAKHTFEGVEDTYKIR